MDYKKFCDIYLPMSERLFGVANRMLGSQPDAEDAVQDLYIKLWKNREILDAIHNPDGYCVTLMKNLCIDRIRKASKSVSMPLEEEMCGEGTPDEELFFKELMCRVRGAIESLPESQRQVLELRVFEDMSYDEISAVTGKSAVHLRVLMNAARRKVAGKVWIPAAVAGAMAVVVILMHMGNTPEDTFDDPRLAYTEVERIMNLISNKADVGLSKTAKITESVETINNAIEKFKK